MDVKIKISGKEAGTIPYETLAAFYYFCRECGFELDWDSEMNELHLNNGLVNKKVILLLENQTKQLFNNVELEWKILNQIKSFLSNYVVNTIFQINPRQQTDADLKVSVSLINERNIKEPLLELSHNLKSKNEKWLVLLENECRRIGTRVLIRQEIIETKPFVNILIKTPEISGGGYWEKYGERLALIFATGILSYLQSDTPLSPFSLLTGFPHMLDGFLQNKQTPPREVTKEKHAKKDGKDLRNKNEFYLRTAEVFLDYHLILNNKDQDSLTFFGNVHIKNTGTESLKNPIICLRVTPAGSLNISGQILPPNVANTLGVMSDSGTRGWKFMNKNWLEEMESKGEIWISPIGQMIIQPHQTESLLNVQMKILSDKHTENLLVEVFVFFREYELKIEGNNRISILFKRHD